jgi:thioredoxin reductase
MIVVGGSFIGMETASSLKSMGCDVSVIAMETVPFERVLGKKVGAAFARLLQKEGVQWYGSAQVRLFRGNDVVNGVELEDGEVLPADGVVIGAGVFPNTRFLEGVPLDKDGAVVVNPLLAAEKFPSFFCSRGCLCFPVCSHWFAGKNRTLGHRHTARPRGSSQYAWSLPTIHFHTLFLVGAFW